jgi:hypothetical protein
MKSKYLQWLAIVLILETGFIHFAVSQHAYEEAGYLGYVFIANFLGSLVAGYGIYRQKTWGWLFGFGIAAGSIAAYGWSRTLGLPGTAVEEWLVPSGVLALAVEGIFILNLLFAPWKHPVSNHVTPSKPSFLSQFMPAFVIFVMVLGTGGAVYVDSASGISDHKRVVSVNDVNEMQVLSANELEEQFGMRVMQVAISALDSIVDVRLKVTDPEKADSLLESHTVIFVDNQAIIHAPHMHTHAKLKPGQIYIMFFPTQHNTVQTGSQVSLVFGDVRADSVIVK